MGDLMIQNVTLNHLRVCTASLKTSSMLNNASTAPRSLLNQGRQALLHCLPVAFLWLSHLQAIVHHSWKPNES